VVLKKPDFINGLTPVNKVWLFCACRVVQPYW